MCLKIPPRMYRMPVMRILPVLPDPKVDRPLGENGIERKWVGGMCRNTNGALFSSYLHWGKSEAAPLKSMKLHSYKRMVNQVQGIQQYRPPKQELALKNHKKRAVLLKHPPLLLKVVTFSSYSDL